MRLLTTTIGSYPKPDFLEIKDRVHPDSGYNPTYDEHAYYRNRKVGSDVDRATIRAVLRQLSAGIDVPTDGEQGREHYIAYHQRHLGGITFAGMQVKEGVRGVPAVYGLLHHGHHPGPRQCTRLVAGGPHASAGARAGDRW